MVTKIQEWLFTGCLACCLVILGSGAYVTVWYGLQSAASVQRATSDLTMITASVHRTSMVVEAKVNELDMGKVDDSLRLAKQSLSNVAAITADGKHIADDVKSNWPIIKEAGAITWQHGNDVLGHLDIATLAEQEQQKEIATLTAQNLRASKRTIDDFDGVITDPNIPLAVSHVTAAAQSVQGMADDGKAIADYYKKILLTPKKWWQKITTILETAYYGRGALGK